MPNDRMTVHALSQVHPSQVDNATRATTALSDMLPPELLQFLVLRRAHHGGLGLSASGIAVDRGRRVPDYLTDTLHTLISDGFLATAPDPVHPARQLVHLTPAGARRYTKLDAHRAKGGRWRELACLDLA